MGNSLSDHCCPSQKLLEKDGEKDDKNGQEKEKKIQVVMIIESSVSSSIKVSNNSSQHPQTQLPSQPTRQKPKQNQSKSSSISQIKANNLQNTNNPPKQVPVTYVQLQVQIEQDPLSNLTPTPKSDLQMKSTDSKIVSPSEQYRPIQKQSIKTSNRSLGASQNKNSEVSIQKQVDHMNNQGGENQNQKSMVKTTVKKCQCEEGNRKSIFHSQSLKIGKQGEGKVSVKVPDQNYITKKPKPQQKLKYTQTLSIMVQSDFVPITFQSPQKIPPKQPIFQYISLQSPKQSDPDLKTNPQISRTQIQTDAITNQN